MEKKYLFEKLNVSISDTRAEMGVAGAQKAADLIAHVLERKDEVNMIFASAPSQMDVLSEMLKREDIPWDKINAFHMDEYIGLPGDAPQSFGNYLRVRLFQKAHFKSVHYLDGNAADIQAECRRYAALLRQYPVDICIMGIGANGHLAFNDPGIADFCDPLDVKVNEHLDETCIQQQVHDGWFAAYDDVPKSALTITMPALVRAPYVVAVVPDISKSEIVGRFFEKPISTELPASVIRQHRNAWLYLDADSASKIALERLSAQQD